MSSQIKCYVINLDRSKDRLEHITRVFDEQRLSFERVPAVDGAILSDEEFKQHSDKFILSRKLVKSELGCFLSHRECWRRIVENDSPWVAVFEDDILFSSNISILLQDVSWIPKDTDIVKLDTYQDNKERKYTIGPTHYISTKNKLPYRIGRLLSKHYCTGGYIISKQCAKKLYDSVEYAFAPIDVIYFNANYGMLLELNVQQMIPAVVIQQSEYESTIDQERRPNLQRQPGQRARRPLSARILREINRIYRRRILPPWLALTKGYRYMKVPFE